MKRRNLWVGLGVTVAVLAGVLYGAATFWTEYAWFVELGFSKVFVTTLIAQVGTGVVFGLVALGLLALHVYLIRRFSRPRTDWVIVTPEGNLDLRDLVARVSTPVVAMAALLVAAGLGYWAARAWEDVLRAFYATPFGRREPILGEDIGFYLFRVPLLQFTQQWLVYLTGLCAAIAAIVYTARGAIVVKGNWPVMAPAVRAHLLFALACVIAAIGWGFRIEMYETLFSKRGIAYGATFTDVKANLIAYRLLIVACIVCAGFLLVAMRSGPKTGPESIKWPLISVAGVVALWLLGVFVWPTVVQRLIVNPNELEKERPYLEHAIEGTRRAYGIDRVEVREFPADETLTMKDLAANPTTIDNIKIWDHRPLRETYRQLQVIRLYYDFPNISVDRYRIDGRYWQVMLSARELIHAQLPAQSQTWVNRHLQYTHGYGVCLSPVNHAIGEGLPDLWIKDIPPQSRHEELRITRPEIYYGLESEDYVLVKTTTQEFDYPRGRDNAYCTYQGRGGVGVGSSISRLLFALRFADINLLFTEHLKPESRLLFNRSIQQRVASVAPFLMLDQEPYIIVADGRLVWVQDAYTISYRYPYSQPTSLGRRKRINYLRNSVKVTIDAYDGSVALYVWDQSDPLIQTYRKMFPSLFKDRREMPAAVRAHVRYPKDLFTIQAAMYESFHMTDPRVFYNQEDKWNIARELDEKAGIRREVPRRQPGVNAEVVTSQARMTPYYMIMRLPGERTEKFLLMLPYTPTNKDNMVAWMTGHCEEEDYGKLRVYVFPKQKLVFGPMQIEARIDQDDYISQWITLRNQQGSSVIRGDLLVIPIEQSILYVEPIYLQSTQTQLPELKQVIVSFGDKVAMQPTLRRALEEVFGPSLTPARANTPEGVRAAARAGSASADAAAGSGPVPGQAGAAGVVAEGTVRLAGEALGHYRKGQQVLGQGDWGAYGREQQQLAEKLEQLSRALESALRPAAPAAQPPAP